MPETSSNVLAVVIAVIIVLVILAVFVLLILVYFNNRKLQSVRHQEAMKRDFEQMLVRTQLEVQEQTMRQISQEIHDNVGQVLSLVNLNLQTLGHYDQAKISNTSSLVNKAIGDLRVLSKHLNPEFIGRQGLTALLRQELSQLEQTGRFSTVFEVEAEPVLPSNKLLILYRMIQEVLNNVIKHSGAGKVEVRITPLQIRIADDGTGFHLEDASGGLGLQHLRERARVIGASVSIQTAAGKGTIVTFNFDNS